MKYLAALVLGLAAWGARADAPDLKTYTCAEYSRFVMSNMSGSDERAKMAVGLQMSWIVGYVSALHQSTTLDGDRLRQMIHDLGNRCQVNPGALVLAQAQEAWAHPQPLASPAPVAK